ncbi:hypothetical protein C9413_21145 [Rhizobium sp. SEMIA 4085]|uniref:Uncharacterized protein n=1 Tax=Rhizobium gallicum bv. gallicum R602sp TaxID=1041138 RepID=A0A0B4XCE2_9HYPH|nr:MULTISPECIES: hypothetical protein [Rhizobium]AJD45674.1 hypothetical protein RGR602_PC01650 [Rhizobium gallicum bv. gallicum R602sp]NNH31889.1 hypothetical protein [Rhizobium sp. SEMIA 4085]TDW32929.1 hypothetical protein EV128_106273 [Rhizobium azibense]
MDRALACLPLPEGLLNASRRTIRRMASFRHPTGRAEFDPTRCFRDASGIILSYFEEVMNVVHIPFGLMERRSRERRNFQNTQALEEMTGKKVPTDIRDDFPKGGSEIVQLRFRKVEVVRGAYDRTVPRCTPLRRSRTSERARMIPLQPHH